MDIDTEKKELRLKRSKRVFEFDYLIVSELWAGDIVGYAPVYQGTNYGVKVTIDANKLTDQPPALWAALLADQGMTNDIATGNRGRVLSILANLPIVPNVVAGFGTSGP